MRACVRACVRVCVCTLSRVGETYGVTWFTFVMITCTFSMSEHCILLHNISAKINYEVPPCVLCVLSLYVV